MSARNLLTRLRRLEVAGESHVLRVIGSMESFEKKMRAAMAEGRVCPTDGPLLIECVRSWVKYGHSERMSNGVVESFNRSDT